MRFKPSQKVVCIKRDVWMSRRTKKPSIGPKFNEVVTVAGPGHEPGCIFIVEYPSNGFSNPAAYIEKWFEPLVSDDVLEAELESIFEVVQR
jgi:hypothetical protein